MPAYQKLNKKFICRGMNLNMPIDMIPENEFAYLKNVRTYEDGKIEKRPGYTLVDELPGAVSGDYIHSGYTLIDENPDTTGGSKRFIGMNTSLFWGDITTPAAFSQVDSGFSGNPLSLIGFAPGQNPAPFLYVGDSNKMRKYNASYLIAGLPAAYYIGVPMSAVYAAGAPVPTLSAGDITGNGYFWRWVLRHTPSGAQSTPSPSTYTALNLVAQQATFPDPAIVIHGDLTLDQQYTWDLYRYGGTSTSWKLVGSVKNRSGGSIVDNSDDAALLSAKVLLVGASDIKYMPFLSPDTPSSGQTTSTTAAVPTSSGVAGNGSLVTGSGFNINWIPGTVIIIGGVARTIARVISTNNLYINEDIGGNLGVVDWSVEGAFEAGFALSALWGPFGSGFFGLYLFGCGNPRAAGTLYWTNGNDPDSVSTVNSLQICSPSEPLLNGCVWNGRVWVWSAQRMWEVVPDLATPGQFIAQIVPGAKGLLGKWSFCVGDYIYFLSKDGIYRFSGNMPENISDHQLRNLLGHDGLNGVPIFLPNPDDFSNPLVVRPPDPDEPNLKYHRLTYIDGILYFDYYGRGGGISSTTLLYDDHTMKGWSLDDYQQSGYRYHIAEDPFHILLIGLGNDLVIFNGDTDASAGISFAIMTKAELLGDIRENKLIGDCAVGAATNAAANVRARLLRLRNQAEFNNAFLTPSGVYLQTIIDANFAQADYAQNALSETVGLWISGTVSTPVVFYDWEPSYVVRPEETKKRATDWDDAGVPGDKFVYGILITANTYGNNRTIEVYGDNNQLIGSLSVNHAFMQTKPYFFAPPLITHMMRIVPVDDSEWELLSVTWKANPKPELSRFTMDWTDDGFVGPKFLQGFVLEGDTQGQDIQVELQVDGGTVVDTFTVNHNGQLEKPYAVPYDCPIIHEMRLVPISGSIRFMEPFKIAWVYTKHPELTAFVDDYSLTDPISYRGVAITADTEGLDVTVQVITNGPDGKDVIQRTLTVNHNGRQQKTYSFSEYILTTAIRLVIVSGVWRHYSTRWIGDPRPDLAPLYTDYSDLGYVGAKFVQGFVLEADTEGEDINLIVEYDGGQQAQTFVRVNHDGQRMFPYSFSEPFIAHLVRIIPTGTIRYQGPWKIKWVWEPAPELAKRWITQTTSHGFRGYFHHRDAYFAIQSFDTVTFRCRLDDGSTHNYIVPSTGGAIRKPYEVLENMKCKLSDYSLISCKPFRVFQKDTEVRVKEWGVGEDFTVSRPFGDLSFERGARI